MTTHALKRLQQPDGSFVSRIVSARGETRDCSGFIAATVLRLTRHLETDGDLDDVRRAALAFVSTCRTQTEPAAFACWPQASRPAWAAAVPADVDDTALMLTELLRYERITRDDALRVFCHAALPQRVRPDAVAIQPPWVMPGAFRTWIPDAAVALPTARPNVVDCCVNANVVALMALLNATHLPGYDEAIATVVAGVTWAGHAPGRWRAITPFYPSPRSLAEACAHALEAGAAALAPALDALQRAGASEAPDAGCCSDAYGTTVWHCEAIDVARALAESMARPWRHACH